MTKKMKKGWLNFEDILGIYCLRCQKEIKDPKKNSILCPKCQKEEDRISREVFGGRI
jgi:Zn finger protein HypA/HybF involved in hydrogenase expression